MSNEHKQLLSDERIVTNAHGDWTDLLSGDEEINIDWADGFKSGHRKGQRVVRAIYEAERTKLLSLLQVCADACFTGNADDCLSALSQLKSIGIEPSNK